MFRPKGDTPWPQAGVSRTADGRCRKPRLDQNVVEWRRTTDWCLDHKPKNPKEETA